MTMLGTKLPLSLGEPPHGYVSRLARSFGIGAAEFCLDMGFTLQQVVDGRSAAIIAIADLVGLTPQEVGSYAMLRDGTGCVLRGQRLTRDTLRRKRLHVCPQCLLKDMASTDLPANQAAYVRATWLVEPVRTCVRHGIALTPIDGSDHVDGSGSHDLAARVSTCLPRLGDMVGTAGRREATRLERYLIGRIDGGDACPLPWLDCLAFHVAANLCEMVGAVRIHGRTPNLNTLNESQWCEAGAAGFEVLEEGEAFLRAFLSDLQATYDYKAAAGPQAVFGRLYQWLAFSARDQDFDPVRELVAEHVIETVPLPAGENVLGHTVERRRLHSIHSAAIETGLHPKRLRRLLVAAGHVDPGAATRARGQTDHRVVFSADVVADFLASASEQLSHKEAGEYLGAPRVQMRIIAEENFIRPIVEAEHGWQRAFARSECDRFLNDLTRSAVSVDDPGPGRVDIPTAAKASNRGAAEIIRLILDQRLAWVGVSQNRSGYLSVLVDVSEVRRLTRKEELAGVPWTDLTRALSVSDRTAKMIVQTGILTTTTVRHPVNRCPVDVVSYEDVEAFRAEYVTLFGIARQTGVHFRKVKATLEASGVLPCLSPDVMKAAIYRRVDVKTVVSTLSGKGSVER